MDKGGYEEALRYLVARQIDVYVDPDTVARKRSSRKSSAI